MYETSKVKVYLYSSGLTWCVSMSGVFFLCQSVVVVSDVMLLVVNFKFNVMLLDHSLASTLFHSAKSSRRVRLVSTAFVGFMQYFYRSL